MDINYWHLHVVQRSVKLKYGHRGGNHPVKDLISGRTELTVQNHGYAVDEASIEGTDLEVTHIALNDGSIEGVKHTKYPSIFRSISSRSITRT